MAKSNLEKLNKYRRENIQAARIALVNPRKYPGVIQEWARLMLTKSFYVEDDGRLPLTTGGSKCAEKS